MRKENGLEEILNVTERVSYPAFDVVLEKPALFKLILNTAVTSDLANVVLADGSALLCDVILLDAMNAQVVNVKSASSTVLIGEFGLFR